MSVTQQFKETLGRLVGAPINDESLYDKALRHGSLFRLSDDGHVLSNERLEFFGDAIIDFLVAETLFHHFPDRDEGFLTRVRARIVNGAALAEIAASIDLGRHILMSDDMERSGGRTNASILAGALEALVGAIYLDQGEDGARQFLNRVMLDDIDLEVVADQRDNFKSMLLEFSQARKWGQPVYRVVEEEGPPHARTFTSEVILNSEVMGSGRAGSKKMAEQHAAKEAFQTLKERDET